MNDNDLKTVLRRGAGPVELPADVADRVQAAMHEELDRTLGTGTVISMRVSRSQAARRPGNLVRVAAAVLVVAAMAGLFLGRRAPSVDDASTALDVSRPPQASTAQEASPPPQLPYLVACLDFIDSTSVDGQPWHAVLADSGATTPPDYLATLASSIDELLATNPEAGAAAQQLRAATFLARSSDPDLDAIVEQLESAQESLYATTLVFCLTASNGETSLD